MMEHLRLLDDPSNTAGTLLTLPLSDFPNNNTTAAAASKNQESSNTTVQDDDDLILISLPPSNANAGGITMDDLINGTNSVYILGDTSERDVHNSTPANKQEENNTSGGGGGSIEPVAARLIVEGKAGKTMELTRVETSNTYIVVPPMPTQKETMNSDNADGSDNKRQKLDSNSSSNKKKDGKKNNNLVTMPARSIGLVPGEDSPSCFFLDPLHLKPGHFGSQLRGTLSRWMYDPFDPPVESAAENNEGGTVNFFGYTIPELAHICRTSQSEIEHAIYNRVFGAEDAMTIPSSNTTPSSSSTRYGMLSEEGRQTVAMAIVSALLESDLELVWKFSAGEEQGKGLQLSLLMEEIRTHWHRLEGGETSQRAPSQFKNPYLTDSKTNPPSQDESQSQFGTPSQFPATQSTISMQLSDEVIWHCLRPVLHYADTSTKNMMPETVQLLPDEVAKLAAHHVFLTGMYRSSTATSSVGAHNAVTWDEEELIETWSSRLPSMSSKYEPRMELLQGIAISKTKEVDGSGEAHLPIIRQWQYFPEAGLPLVPSLRIKSMFAMQDVWTLEEAVPYLEKFIVKDGGELDNGKGGLHSMAADLFGQYAKAIHRTEKDGNGKNVSVTKYVAIPN